MRFLKELENNQLLVSARAVERAGRSYKKYIKLFYGSYFIFMPLVIFVGGFWYSRDSIMKGDQWIAVAAVAACFGSIYLIALYIAVRGLDNWTEFVISEAGIRAQFLIYPGTPATQDISWTEFDKIRIYTSVMGSRSTPAMGALFYLDGHQGDLMGTGRKFVRFCIWPAHFKDYRAAFEFAIHQFHPEKEIH